MRWDCQLSKQRRLAEVPAIMHALDETVFDEKRKVDPLQELYQS